MTQIHELFIYLVQEIQLTYAMISQNYSSQKNNIYIMSLVKDTFLELPDEIPYKRITYFKIASVVQVNNTFKISVDRKFESLPQQKYQIIRKIPDFQWLLSQLHKQNPDLIVLPSMIQSNWSFIESITNRLSDNSRMEMKRWSNGYFLTRMVQRFLKMLSEVSIHNIYRMPGLVKSSLFTFLDINYELYKMQTYQESYQQKTSQKDENLGSFSTITSIAQTIGQGGMKILGMLNVIRKQSASEYLEHQLKGFNDIQAEIKQINKQIEGIQKSLEILMQNFLNEKGLKQKFNEIFQIYLKSTGYHKVVTQIIGEINNITAKCQALKGKKEDKQDIKQQLKTYQKFLSTQLTQIRVQFSAIVLQLYKKCYQDEISLRLQDFYPIKPLIK